jgi:hypothetical protein
LQEARLVATKAGEQDLHTRHLDSQIVRCRCGKPCWQKPCHTVQHCRWCARPMRLTGWPRSSNEQEVVYGGKGYCMTHYETVNNAGTEDVLDADLDAAVESYWRNRDLVRAGLSVDRDA